ncbi:MULTISPECIES: AprI/Inh family metalloprotease inhibitor [Methylosinus]|uniref:Alkaline proteinase inhibitor/ Outer membrane lipoprotein Omp19 domain-containing protein n=1 Tax=Methylosinus trichosporium (strain ATCC 35070 / NCIMB 11131 / UNIQEM 75 / OB3b) TaxID=595536 RepID=A0A2D2CXR1_METT3|nr:MULTISPECIES: AprI/Inh family metalloprotease inhibitor [Methylosinus]ATQ67541.1 hypothetical protein CQW49_06300 [Methylosinus trichosporium OB3b]
MSKFSEAAVLAAGLWLAVAGFSSAPAFAAGAGRSGAVAGRYAILRADDKDTGCMLTLYERARGAGEFRAQLAPACRDQGVVIFDPVGWSLERGRLALTARKGHQAHFEQQADGVWRRDAKEGKALALKRL